MKRILRIHGNEITLPQNLHRYLNVVLDSFSLRVNSTHLSINFRDTSYYHRSEGAHPVEMRIERDSEQHHIWHLVFIASFSYPNEHQPSVTTDLYFNFKRRLFYQTNTCTCDLASPVAISQFKVWAFSFTCQLRTHRFDDISANEIRI